MNLKRQRQQMPENRKLTEATDEVPKGKSGNPGGRPKVLGEVQELARQYAPAAIVELARLALKAKNETARIAAIRELLDRGYGRTRQSVEVSAPDGNPSKYCLRRLMRSRGGLIVIGSTPKNPPEARICGPYRARSRSDHVALCG